MTSTGKGRLYRTRHYPTLRGGIRLPSLDLAAQGIGNDTFWGSAAPPSTRIPYAWLTPPARWRSDQPRNVATITRTGGSAARAQDANSVAAVQERPYVATVDSQVPADPTNYAQWIVAYYTSPRQRMPQLTLNLLPRTDVECWRILDRKIGDRISITGAPGGAVQLLSNPWFESGVSPWTGQSASVAQSALFSRSGSNSMQITPAGGIGTVNGLSEIVTVADGESYTTEVWVMAPAGWSDVAVGFNFYTAGSFVGTSFGAPAAVSAGVWTRLTYTATATAGADGGQVRVRLGSTPTNSDLVYADEATMTGPAVRGWPTGVTELIIEGISHRIGNDTRWVVWNTTPVIGSTPGVAGPWFRTDESRSDGTDAVPF